MPAFRTATDKYGSIFAGLCVAAFEREFGREWIELDSERSRVVARDFADASEEESLSVREYARRIGRGNLRAYADTQLARRDW